MAITAAQLVAAISISGADAAKAQLNSVGGATDSLGGKLKNALGSAFSLAAGAAGQALQFVGSQFVDSIKQAANFQTVIDQTTNVLKSTKDASGETIKSLEDMASSLSNVTDFSEGTIVSGQNMLLTFTNIGSKVFPQATQSMLDLAQATGENMQSAAVQLGKSLNDPVQGVTALSKVGVSFTQSQKDAIASMVKTGDVAGAQKVILQELQKEFGNSAQAAGKGFGGQLQILQNHLNDFKIGIGTAVLPILTQLVGAISTSVLPLLQRFGGWFSQNAVPVLKSFGDIISQHVTPLIGGFGQTINQLMPKIQPLGATLSGIFKQAQPVIQSVGGVLKQVFDGIAGSAGPVIQSIKQNLLPAIGNLASAIGPVIKNIADWITKSNIVPTVFNVIKTVVGVVTGVLGGLISVISNVIKFFTQTQIGGDILKAVFITLAAGIGIVALVALPGLIIGFGAAAISALAAGASMLLAFAPIVIPILAISAVIFGVIEAIQHWGAIVGWLKGVWGAVSGFFGGIFSAIGGFFSGIGNKFKEWFQTAWNNVVAVFGHIGQKLIGFWNAEVQGWANIGAWFRDRFTDAWNAITGVFSHIGKFLFSLWTNEVQGWENIGSWFHDRFTDAWNAVTGVFQHIGQFLMNLWNREVQGWENIGAWFHDRFQQAWNNITAIFGNVGNWFHDRFTDVSNRIQSALSGVKQFASNVWNSITGDLKSAFNTIIDQVNNVISNIDKISVAGFSVHIPLIPHLAAGTNFFSGGLALVGEQGPELAYLPRGTNVIPAGQTSQMLSGGGYASNSGSQQPVYLQIDGRTFARLFMPYFTDQVRLTTGVRF